MQKPSFSSGKFSTKILGFRGGGFFFLADCKNGPVGLNVKSLAIRPGNGKRFEGDFQARREMRSRNENVARVGNCKKRKIRCAANVGEPDLKRT